jgi:hypothetical protein
MASPRTANLPENHVTTDEPPPIDLAKLRFEMSPFLVTYLVKAGRESGAIAATPLSDYTLRRLAAEARVRRIASALPITPTREHLDEVARVANGAVLPRNRWDVMGRIQRATVLHEVVAQFASRGGAANAASVATYLGILRHDPSSAQWERVMAPRGADFFETLPALPPDPWVNTLFEWIAKQEHLAFQPLLRAALLNWALARRFPYGTERPAIHAVVYQELRDFEVDGRRLLVLADTPQGQRALRTDDGVAFEANYHGDLTALFEQFADNVGQALAAVRKALVAEAGRESRQPWMAVPPPDELDRRIFDAIERRKQARAQEILVDLDEPRPPLRTLQRRIQQLVQSGLLEKHGSRKAAHYSITHWA